LLPTSFEYTNERRAKACGVERHELLDQDEIHKILHPTARLSIPIASRVRVNLFCNMLLERQDGYLNRLNAGERKKIRAL
jgi:hypothetical protein